MKTLEILCWTVAALLVGGVVAMAAFGWLSVQNTDDETNIKIDRKEIREDIDEAVEQGRKLLKSKEDKPDDQDGQEKPKTIKDGERTKEAGLQ